MNETDDKVVYEVSIRDTKAGRVRLFEALLEAKAEVNLGKVFRFPESLSLIVRMTPGAEESFRQNSKCFECLYQSPYRFDNGALFPIYASAELEVEAHRRASQEIDTDTREK
jgi:hypothetical protein